MTSSSTASGSGEQQKSRRGKRDSETKALAAGLLAQGLSHQAVCAEVGIVKTTLWRWCTQDAEFRAMRARLTDEIVAANVQAMRALSTDVVSALARGVRSTHRQTTVKMGESYEVVNLEDNSLAVRTADIIAKRMAEFAEQKALTVTGSEHLAQILDELDDGADG